MGPEFLGAGLVFLQRLLLRAGLAGPRDKGNCRERKNRSMESRYHRVTPYAAGRLRMFYFVLDVSRDEVLVRGRADQEMVSHRQLERSAPSAVLADGNRLRKNFFRPDDPDNIKLDQI